MNNGSWGSSVRGTIGSLVKNEYENSLQIFENEKNIVLKIKCYTVFFHDV